MPEQKSHSNKRRTQYQTILSIHESLALSWKLVRCNFSLFLSSQHTERFFRHVDKSRATSRHVDITRVNQSVQWNKNCVHKFACANVTHTHTHTHTHTKSHWPIYSSCAAPRLIIRCFVIGLRVYRQFWVTENRVLEGSSWSHQSMKVPIRHLQITIRCWILASGHFASCSFRKSYQKQ